MLALVPNAFQYALFGWAGRFVDLATANVLMSLSTLMLALLLSRLLSDRGVYRRNMRVVLLLFLVALTGVFLVVASEAGELGVGFRSSPGLLAGLLLSLLAALSGALGAFTFRWGRDLALGLEGGPGAPAHGVDSVTLFGALLAHGISSGPGLLASAGLGALRGEVLPTPALVSGFLGGLALQGLGNLLFLRANLAMTNLGINALSYLASPGGLVVLALLHGVGVARPFWLVAGTGVIVAANLLASLEGSWLPVLLGWGSGRAGWSAGSRGWGWPRWFSR